MKTVPKPDNLYQVEGRHGIVQIGSVWMPRSILFLNESERDGSFYLVSYQDNGIERAVYRSGEGRFTLVKIEYHSRTKTWSPMLCFEFITPFHGKIATFHVVDDTIEDMARQFFKRFATPRIPK